MILTQFQTWVRTAPAGARADGASALARAYLYADLSETQRREAMRVLTNLLDDSSPLVRRALSEALADAKDAPHHIVLALADDQADIAAPVLARSPILTDAELIDCAATSKATAQAAIASRVTLSPPVGAALAEVGAPDALVVLANNRAATLPAFAIRRMVERHGEHAELREALLTRSDLPVCVRMDLVAATTRALAAFVTERSWLSNERMNRVATEAKDRAAITIAGVRRDSQLELVAHLRQSGQLSVGLAFRAILSGKLELFKSLLSELSGTPLFRVDGLARHCESTGFAALYRKAGLPADLLPAFRAALHAARQVEWARGAQLSRAAIERVLAACNEINSGELDKLLVLLRRFEAEAARDEARAEAKASASTPLTLSDPILAEPLPLSSHDSERRMPSQGLARQPRRREPTFTIDMAALAAELCAA